MTERSDQRDRSADAFEPIRPADVDLTVDGRVERSDRPAGSGRSWLPMVALAVLLAIGALVVLVLPGRFDGEGAPTPSPADPPEPTAPAETDTAQGSGEAGEEAAASEEVVPPFRQLELERQRTAAQDVLQRLVSLQDQLEARAVERWGAEELAAARTLATEGDDLFLERDYEAAQQRYREAVARLEALLARADEVVAEALARGEAALERGDAEAARTAFALARAADPGNAAAERGAARAATLDELRDLLAEARELMEDGRFEAAAERIGRARELDPYSDEARTAGQELDRRAAARRFNQAISRGYAALGRGAYDQAREQFRAALGIRSGAEEAEEGLRMVEQQSVAARIADLRTQAQALAQAEDWSAAAERFETVLELDDTLAFAREGAARARDRLELRQALDEMLAATDELNDEAVFERASALLERARAADPRGPEIEARTRALAEALRIAAEPVPVTLVSDGETRVVLLQVARLGTFERRVLDLNPGGYTAVGSRDGYRDVRVEFLVTENGTEAPVAVRCEERI